MAEQEEKKEEGDIVDTTIRLYCLSIIYQICTHNKQGTIVILLFSYKCIKKNNNFFYIWYWYLKKTATFASKKQHTKVSKSEIYLEINRWELIISYLLIFIFIRVSHVIYSIYIAKQV